MPLTLAAALTAAQVAAPFQIAQMKTSQPAPESRQAAPAHAPAQAEEEAPASALAFAAKNNLGVQFSTISGSGICYRSWLSDGFGFSVAGIPYQTTDGDKQSGFINFGGQVMKSFYEGPLSRLYALAGAGTGIFFDSNRQDTNFSAGLGVDYVMAPKVLLTAAIGYSQATQNRRNENKISTSFEPGYTVGFFFAF